MDMLMNMMQGGTWGVGCDGVENWVWKLGVYGRPYVYYCFFLLKMGINSLTTYIKKNLLALVKDGIIKINKMDI